MYSKCDAEVLKSCGLTWLEVSDDERVVELGEDAVELVVVVCVEDDLSRLPQNLAVVLVQDLLELVPQHRSSALRERLVAEAKMQKKK